MFKKTLTALALASVTMSGVFVAGAAEARDQMRIVGSSTVFPFSTAVAEQFGKSSGFKTPVVESTGSGGGLKLFCAGSGDEHADITNSSSGIKQSQVNDCVKNGVTDITAIKIGYDGIVIANAKAAARMNITRQELWLALAKDVVKDGKIVANPYKTWNEINPNLPAIKIEVMGPPPTSGTRDAFVELVMDKGCAKFAEVEALDKNAKKSVCASVREDGAFIEAGENDNLIVQKLDANHNAFGIFGYSFLDQNMDKLQGSIVEGKEPTFENIAASKYPVSRPLWFYVKKAHVGKVPGIQEFMAEFTSEKAWGEEGYLAEKGLIPMPKAEREKFRKAAMDLANNVNDDVKK